MEEYFLLLLWNGIWLKNIQSILGTTGIKVMKFDIEEKDKERKKLLFTIYTVLKIFHNIYIHIYIYMYIY